MTWDVKAGAAYVYAEDDAYDGPVTTAPLMHDPLLVNIDRKPGGALVGIEIVGIDRLDSDSLDAAWREVEDVLPEGWWIDSVSVDGYPVEMLGGARVTYTTWRAEAKGPMYADAVGSADTPAAALSALAARLRERAS